MHISQYLCFGRQTPCTPGLNVFRREQPLPLQTWAAEVDEQRDLVFAGGKVIEFRNVDLPLVAQSGQQVGNKPMHPIRPGPWADDAR